MRRVINIDIDQIKPEAGAVLKTQGIPEDTAPPPRVQQLYQQAEKLFMNLALPKAVMQDISIDDFAAVFKGEGQNEAGAPLENIFPRAPHLALAAFTLGPEISNEIEEQMKGTGLAVGYMLDAVASYCADKGAAVLAGMLHGRLTEAKRLEASTKVLMYSPGYCGWHITAQRKLFQYLTPGLIGLSLNDSCLMTPLKSISGVLVAGEKELHMFNNAFPFCKDCRTLTCRQRIQNL